MAKQKDLSIETLRGLAILLMVAGHVIGNQPANGMRVAEDSGFRHFYYSLQFLRMPLFTVISGFVYTLRPVQVDKVLSFLRGKSRRILLPLISVATLEFFMILVGSGTNSKVELSEIWRIYVFPFDHFWFLQAIFVVFLAVTLLERFALLRTPLLWGAALALAVWILWWPPVSVPWFFSLPAALYLFPFFLLGVGLGRFPTILRSPWVVAPAAVVLVLAVVWQQGAWFHWPLPLLDRLETGRREGLLGITLGLTGCLILFRVRWKTGWLAWLGYYAYGIYLFHVFGTAGTRIALKKFLGLETGIPMFLLCLAAGLAVPIVIEVVLERFGALRLLFFGLRPEPKPQQPADSDPEPAAE